MTHSGSDVKTYLKKYKTKNLKFSFPEIDDIHIETIADIDSLIDEISDDEFNDDERLPYWAEIWPSAIGLSNYLAKQHSIENQSVLELGSGLGLAGIVAQKLGGEVTFSDNDVTSLRFCEHNGKLNGLKKVETMLLDWREPNIEREYDIIIAADVIYEERYQEPVLNMIRSLLVPGGKAIIAEPGRNIAINFFTHLKNNDIPFKNFIEKTQHNNSIHDIGIYVIN